MPEMFIVGKKYDEIPFFFFESWDLEKKRETSAAYCWGAQHSRIVMSDGAFDLSTSF